MKMCPACKADKPFIEFARNRAKKDGCQSVCKLCKRERDKQSYQNNIEWYKKRNRRRQAELVKWYRSLKDDLCTDCGNSYHFAIMQFDHLPGFTKIKAVSLLVSEGASRERILDEIKKCELVCSNCHGMRTFQRLQCGLGELADPPVSDTGVF